MNFQLVAQNKILVSKKWSDSELRNWYHADSKFDSIPGISLNNWHKTNKRKQKSKQIIVAVIDTQIDINHEDLKGQIWTNKKEIANNNIDDDKNGFVDDINGWNFLGTKSKNYTVWINYEYVRYVRKWMPLFNKKIENQLEPEYKVQFKEYQRALKKLNSEIEKYKDYVTRYTYTVEFFPKSKDTLKHFFPKEDYNYQQLDSLYKKYKINDKTYQQRRLDKDIDLGTKIDFMKIRFQYNQNEFEKVLDLKIQYDSILNKNLNLNYNDRLLIGDDEKVLNSKNGTNNISAKINGIRAVQDHCTEVSGVIASNRENTIGIKGFSNSIKIMPLTICGFGDENDKDIANAIRYAVDNGAKVINMSFGKEFSMHQDWVTDAFKYAEVHNVLLVHCSGNEQFDTDTNPYYPSDVAFDGTPEVCGNFINVGSTSKNLNENFVSSFSNYGKKNVDLFAPGEEIYITMPENKYAFDSGTSLAGPMISGTAALIWLYYPKLTVQQIKKIILESGTSFDIEVLVPGGNGKKAKFSELSKSGKLLNVYNAMQMAQKMSKSKK